MSTLIGDKAYDGDGFRAEIVNCGAKPVIPNKSNRVTLHSFSKPAYQGRKDFRRQSARAPETSWLPSTSPPLSPVGLIESGP